jgi:hypothetical protein
MWTLKKPLTLMISFVLVLLVYLWSCSLSRQYPQELVVASFSPAVDPQDDQFTIRFSFNRPVVSEEQVGFRSMNPPLIGVAPFVRFASIWVDRQTLMLQPVSKLQPSTRYSLALESAFPSLSGRTRFAFVHRPLVVERVAMVDLATAPFPPKLILLFNQRVKAEEVTNHCVLHRDSDDQITRLATNAKDHTASSIEVYALSALARGQEYALYCVKLTGVGGNWSWERPLSYRFSAL